MSDFLIIGGGVAGLSVAAALAPLGSVTLLEAEPHLGTQASARSAAIFLETYGNDVVRALNSASLDAYRAMEVFAPRPLLMLGARGGEETFERERDSFGAREIAVAEAAGLWPILNRDHVARAALYEGPQDMDTDRIVQGYAREARAGGARLVAGAPVTEIRRDATGWTLRAGAEEVTGRFLVNAAGAWADRVAAMAGVAPLGLQPYRRSMARLAAPGGHDTRDWPFVDDAGGGWYAKPDAGALLVSPFEADPMDPHDAWADDMVIAEGLARYEEFVTEPVTRPMATWAGLRTFAPDEALVIGRDRAVPDFLWCAGQGGYGFQTAPAAAALLAAVASGAVPELAPDVVSALSPGRFLS